MGFCSEQHNFSTQNSPHNCVGICSIHMNRTASETIVSEFVIVDFFCSDVCLEFFYFLFCFSGEKSVIWCYSNGFAVSGFSRNSDPEPWRCRRTDGKKWRCTRDVAPNQKYCERHCHKTKPRSRKPVELPSQSHNNTHSHTTTTNNTSKTNITNNNTLNTHSLANTAAQKPPFHIPTMVSGPTYAQPRYV